MNQNIISTTPKQNHFRYDTVSAPDPRQSTKHDSLSGKIIEILEYMKNNSKELYGGQFMFDIKNGESLEVQRTKANFKIILQQFLKQLNMNDVNVGDFVAEMKKDLCISCFPDNRIIGDMYSKSTICGKVFLDTVADKTGFIMKSVSLAELIATYIYQMEMGYFNFMHWFQIPSSSLEKGYFMIIEFVGPQLDINRILTINEDTRQKILFSLINKYYALRDKGIYLGDIKLQNMVLRVKERIDDQLIYEGDAIPIDFSQVHIENSTIEDHEDYLKHHFNMDTQQVEHMLNGQFALGTMVTFDRKLVKQILDLTHALPLYQKVAYFTEQFVLMCMFFTKDVRKQEMKIHQKSFIFSDIIEWGRFRFFIALMFGIKQTVPIPTSQFLAKIKQKKDSLANAESKVEHSELRSKGHQFIIDSFYSRTKQIQILCLLEDILLEKTQTYTISGMPCIPDQTNQRRTPTPNQNQQSKTTLLQSIVIPLQNIQ